VQSTPSRASLRRSLQAETLDTPFAQSPFADSPFSQPQRSRWFDEDELEKPINKCDQRIKRISEQMSRIQLDINTNRDALVQYVFDSMNIMSYRLQESKVLFDGSLQEVKDTVQKLEDGLAEEQDAMDKCLQTEAWNIGDKFDRVLETFLQKQQKLRTDCEKNTITRFDERLDALLDRFVNEKKSRTRQDRERMLDDYINTDLPQLYKDHEEMRLERECMENNIVRFASQEITRLREAVLSEKQKRDRSASDMRKMFADVVGQVRADLDQERAERIQMEDSMLKLIDLAADRLQKTPEFSETVIALKQVVAKHTRMPLSPNVTRRRQPESDEQSNTKRLSGYLSPSKRR